MRLDIKDAKYGCFTTDLKCNNCNKILVHREFSWDNDHISTGDMNKILQIFRDMLTEDEIYYCPKCGTELRLMMIEE